MNLYEVSYATWFAARGTVVVEAEDRNSALALAEDRLNREHIEFRPTSLLVERKLQNRVEERLVR